MADSLRLRGSINRSADVAENAWLSGKGLLAAWVLAFGAGTLVILASSVQTGVVKAMSPEQMPTFWQLILWPALFWYMWVLLVPFVFGLVRRTLLTRATWARQAGVLAGGMFLFYVLHVALQVLSMALPAFHDTHRDLADAVSFHVSRSIYTNAVTYWVLVGVAYALLYYRRYRKSEVEAARLESELARAQLQALRMQLQPHFLFNALNSISSLMYRDVRAADQMVGHLGDLLRVVIQSEGEQEVPLRDEIAFVEKYLQIEQVRFGDRLTVAFDVAPDVQDALVPNLVLQPLVENALKHGVGAQSGQGRIDLRAWREGDQLRLRIHDNGAGRSSQKAPGMGVGLANTRARLLQLYGSRAALYLQSEDAGVAVSLVIPYQTVPLA